LWGILSLDEHYSFAFKKFGELANHTLAHSSMEVHPNVHPQCANFTNTFHGPFQELGRIEPRESLYIVRLRPNIRKIPL
jgi:hypothetical protein